ncbi:MAG: PAS-domain containing protein, partial [Pseudomonadota bacterium]
MNFLLGILSGISIAFALWLFAVWSQVQKAKGLASSGAYDPKVIAKLIFAGKDILRRDLDPNSAAELDLYAIQSRQDATRVLGHVSASLVGPIEDLFTSGVPFSKTTRNRQGQLIEARGRTEGAHVEISLLRASDKTQTTEDIEAKLASVQTDLDLVKALLSQTPTQCAVVDASGSIVEANDALDRSVWTDTYNVNKLAPELRGLLDKSATTGKLTVHLTIEDDIDVPFEVVLAPAPQELCALTGQSDPLYLLSLSDISRETDAENAMNALMMTLTQIFAHLSIGLAVFDADRHMTMFNPALAQMTGLDAAALAQRPTLRDFFEALRRTRMLPEQSDFRTWKRKILAVEDDATDGTYQEDWVLPSGQVFRVTGRTHGRGGLAFLFDDIT